MAQASVLKNLAELPEYRQVLWNLVSRDLKVKYQRSALGFVWTLVYPAFMLGIYFMIFGVILKFPIPNFWAYLLAGLLPFQFIQGAVIEGAAAIRRNSNLTRKIYFPQEILVIGTVTTKLVEFVLQLVVGVLFLLLWHRGGDLQIDLFKAAIVLPGAIILLYLFALGVALPVAAWSIIYKDLEHILALFMTAWFYVTPIFWSLEHARQHLTDTPLKLFALNPALDLLALFRGPLYYGAWPQNPALGGSSITAWGLAMLVSVASLLIGYTLFNRSKRILAEIV